MPISNCCPVTGNPLHGSKVGIFYDPANVMLEVISLHAYIESYRGGRGEVRSMEGMIQAIAQDCADCVGQRVRVIAELLLAPEQQMTVECNGKPA